MPDFPSPHAIAALLLTIGSFALFIQARLRIELVCLLIIAVLALGFYAFPFHRESTFTGMEVAFGGFGHPALVAICCLLIIGRALVITGALEPAARVLARLWRFSHVVGMLFTLLVCMGISAFINDTPVLVLALPILLNLAQRAGVAASKTLMPVNFAILIGGMATTIGTSTNVLVVSIAEDLGVGRIGVFSFVPIVAVAALIAFPYLWLVAPRLLPTVRADEKASIRIYNANLHVADRSAAVGKTIDAIERRLPQSLKVGDVVREGRVIGVVPMIAGDQIPLEGTIDDLLEASESLRCALAPEGASPQTHTLNPAAAADRRIAEVAIGGDSALRGRSVREAQLADRYGIAVLGTYRAADAHLFSRPLPTAQRLDVGDVLLVQGTAASLVEFERSEGTMVLRDVLELPTTAKAPIALGITAAVILLAAAGVVPLAIAALAGTIAMLTTGCLKFENIGRALSLEVIVLIAASIALGRALVETGADSWLASIFALALSGLPPALVVAGVMAFAMVLTNFVTNAAAAAISTPLAVSLATQLAIQPEPMVLAVLFGCNLCYITPMAYQTNLLIMGAAGYKFADFVRVGLPLALIMITSLAYLLVQHFDM